jgi:hypothetical protein
VGGRQPPGCLDAVQLRHLNVHDDDRRTQFLDLRQRLQARARRTQHLDFLDAAQEGREAFAEHRVVVDDQHSDSHDTVLLHSWRRLSRPWSPAGRPGALDRAR